MLRSRFANILDVVAVTFTFRDPAQCAAQAFKGGDYNRALRFGRRAVRMDGADQAAQLTLARSLIGLGRLAEADAILAKLEAEMPDPVTVLKMRAIVARRREDHARARDYFGRAYRLDPENFNLACAYASALMRNDEHQSAEPVLQEISKKHPDAAETHRLLSVLAQHRFQFATALEHAEQAIARAPASLKGWERRAEASLSGGDLSRALVPLMEFLPGHENRLQLKRLIARSLVMASQPEARDWLTEILAESPGDPDALIRAARIDETFGKYDDVKRLLASVDTQRPIAQGQIKALGILQHNYGNFDIAQKLWQMGLTVTPRSAEFAIGLAATKLRRGLIHDALADAEALARSTGPQGRHQMIPLLHELGVAIGKRRRNADLTRRVSALRWRCNSRRSGADTLSFLTRQRERVAATRAEGLHDLVNGTAGPSVSFICPIHRPRDLDNLVAQLSRQALRDFEAVVAIHTNDMREADIRDRWTDRGSLKVIDCSNVPALGGVLNAAIAASSGEIILRIDADDLYFPNYAVDMRLALMRDGADIVGKRAIFRYLEASDALYLFSPTWVNKRAHIGAGIPGSALGGWRRIFDEIPFDSDMVSGEDFDFVRRCLARSFHVRFVDPFNHLYRRRPGFETHSWRADDILLPLFDEKPMFVGDHSSIDLVEV